MTLLLGACCVRHDHGLIALTDRAPVRWIGKVSYGIYLLHVAAITATKQILPEALRSAPWIFAVALAGSVAAASASFVWLERPFLRLRDSFRAEPEGGLAL
jgi:peptidoglycan/LPS O-acetylase OafA/YrhL